ncbi:unnamed protein product, partial [Protopolystoma xenopodis]
MDAFEPALSEEATEPGSCGEQSRPRQSAREDRSPHAANHALRANTHAYRRTRPHASGPPASAEHRINSAWNEGARRLYLGAGGGRHGPDRRAVEAANGKPPVGCP